MQSLYQFFYNSLPVKNETQRKLLYTFTEEEYVAIRALERKSIIISACIGAMGVIFLFLPQYLWPQLFPYKLINVFNKTYQVPVVFVLYGGLLALLEIVALTFINIYFIHQTGVVTGFINKTNKQEAANQKLLLNIANERTTKIKPAYCINPMLGLSRQAIFTAFVLQKAKGVLSNAIIKALIGRLGGRFAIKAVQNMIGIPVYAFWDAWAARKIMRRTRAVIMGQNLINDLFEHLPKPVNTSADFKALLYNSLQYIATTKRYYHENHNLLTVKVFERYNLKSENVISSNKDFITRLKAAPVLERSVCAKIMLTGWLLDESIYEREKMHIDTLYNMGLLLMILLKLEVYTCSSCRADQL